jgi:hypothetical protein
VDYAGLFPPASLGMAEAVRNYASYVQGPHAWMLGRFVAPAARLEEFERAASEFLPRGEEARPWRLSALAGPDLRADLAAIDEFNRRRAAAGGGAAIVDAIESKAARPEEIGQAMQLIPADLTAYFEIPVSSSPRDLMAAIAGAGARAKIRTGGETPEAFPSAPELANWLRLCAGAGVPFKATAGLHHPLRGIHRLACEPGSPTGMMHGFLNVFLAAAFIYAGMEVEEAVELLEEESPAAFRFDEQRVTWRDGRLTVRQLREARQQFAHSFGSCSFAEPVEGLQALGLL